MPFSRFWYILLVSLTLVSPLSVKAETLIREATYYADEFQWRVTANGERYAHEYFSLALCDESLSSYYYIASWGTGVVARANDRPNCRKNSNTVDLSQETFRVFSSLDRGRIPDIEVTPIGGPWVVLPKTFLPKTFFEKLGVILENDIPTVLFSWESYLISGRVTGNIDSVMIAFSHEDDTRELRILPQKVSQNKSFDAILEIPSEEGIYHLILINSNQGFQTSTIAKIAVISRERLSYPTLPSLFSRINVSPKILWKTTGIILPENISWKLTLTQWKKSYESSGRVITFRNISLRKGNAQVYIDWYELSTPSPLDRSARIATLFSGSVMLDRKRESIGGDAISIRMRSNIANIRFSSPLSEKINSSYYITFPNGSVNKYTFPVEHTDGKWFLIPGKEISFRFPMTTQGTYLLELLREDGTAFVNIPLYRGRVWSVIDQFTKQEITTIIADRQRVIQKNLSRLNTLRAEQKKGLLVLDAELSKIAQAKVDDFIKRKYPPAHRDIDGNYIGDFAKKRGFFLEAPYAENIASWNISHLALQDGLEESGSHRYAMLSDDFTKVGIGYAVDNGKVILLQVFWD